jgi:citrate synthase
MAQDTLTITDNRTNQTYNFPIAKETVRAMDFRQIKASPEDFGLMTYDPAFMNTASCRSSIHDYPRADRLWGGRQSGG